MEGQTVQKMNEIHYHQKSVSYRTVQRCFFKINMKFNEFA
jgi:hypothetical protein